MTDMGLIADLGALTTQWSARTSATYGRKLYFSGTELPKPRRIKIPTRHGSVRCDLYLPPDVSNPPIYVHFHGGAFLMRYPKMDDFFARHVAVETGAAVINVDYDVAPQARYPVAQHQAHDVIAWLAANAGEWGLDGSRIAVGGFSSGGNLAASACLQARDTGSVTPVLQVLGVPSLDIADTDKRSTIANPMITPALLKLVRASYFKDAARRSEPYASPVRADDLTGLAPAIILTAEYDCLRHEGDTYAARLAGADVAVTHQVVERRDHYFLDGDRAHAKQTLDLLTNALNEAFGHQPRR